MRLTVVLATFQRRELVSRTVRMLLDQDLPRSEYEVIVVVDGSVDGTAAELLTIDGHGALRVLEQPNRGQAVALNVGIKVARAPVVLLMDDDLRCDRRLLSAHLSGHSSGAPTVAFGPILVSLESADTAAADAAREWLHPLNERAAKQSEIGLADIRVGPNTSVRRDLLLRVGGFDPALTRFHADTDLGLKLRDAGAHFRFLPEAIVQELYDKSPAALVTRDAPAFGRNQVRLCRRYPELRPHSALALLADGPLWKVWSRRAAVAAPASPEVFLRGPFALAERLRSIPSFRRISSRLLGARRAVVQYRAAAREAGGTGPLTAEFGARLPVLLYHHVGPTPRESTNPGLTVSGTRFRHQMRWLVHHGYTAISAADWFAWRIGKRTLPARPVLITFDDGYADLTRHAFPILEDLGLTATVFLVTRLLGATNVWDRARGLDEHALMSADDVVRWAARGIDFGAHGRLHRVLTRATASERRDEIEGSAEDLVQLLPRAFKAFAYPFGSFDEHAQDMARGVFDLSFTLAPGMNSLATHPHALRRTMVHPLDSATDFACRVRFGWNPIDGIRRRLGLTRPRRYEFARV